MRGFVAVLERELVERRLLAVVALVAGLLPFLVPFVSNARHLDPAELRSGAALAFGMTFTVIVAIVLGASVLAGDLAERRLGFYFSRPLPGWAVWAGKMAATALLTLGGGLLVLLPASLVGGIDLGSILPGKAVQSDLFSLGLFWVAAALFLILASHAVSVMVRARSPWLAVDLAAAAVVGLLLWDARVDLLFAKALPFAPSPWDVLAAALVFLGLALAGAAQVMHGRTDLRRGHRVLSLTLWGLLLLVAAAGQGFSRWMLDVSPEDLEQVTEVSSSPRGSWAAFSGPARHRGEYRPRFLLDTASGRFFRTGGWWTLFSEDGGRAVWTEPSWRSLRSPELVLYHLDLRDPKAAPAATSITFQEPFFGLALSPGGERVASIRDKRLLVEDLDREKILASIPLPEIPGVLWPDGFLRFLDSGHVLLLARRPLREGLAQRVEGGFEVLAAVADLSPGSALQVRSLGNVPGYPNLSLSPDGGRLFIHGGRQGISRLLDVRTGREIASLTPGQETLWTSSPRFLADGRIVFRKSRQELQVFSPDLVPERTFRFEGVLASEIGSQPAPGRLIVATAKPGGRASFNDPSPWQILLLDLATGEVRSLAKGLLPVEGPNRGPASTGSRLFRDGQGGLVSLDPATGKTRIFVPGSRRS